LGDAMYSEYELYKIKGVTAEEKEMGGLIKKKSHYVYLAGNISDDPRTYQWRVDFTNLLSPEIEEGRVKILDPTQNKFNQKLQGYNKGGVDFIKEAAKRSQRLLRAKDYNMIKISSLMVANLGLVSDNKPLLGTVHEIVWAHDIFYIPIIAITEGQENAWICHPWHDECISAWAKNIEEAVWLIREFFLEY